MRAQVYVMDSCAVWMRGPEQRQHPWWPWALAAALLVFVIVERVRQVRPAPIVIVWEE